MEVGRSQRRKKNGVCKERSGSNERQGAWQGARQGERHGKGKYVGRQEGEDTRTSKEREGYRSQGKQESRNRHKYYKEATTNTNTNTRPGRQKNKVPEKGGGPPGGGGPTSGGGDGETGGKHGGLKILYLNAQSILSKIIDLEATSYDIKPDLILITESWCNDTISDNVLNITGYNLVSELRKDRIDTTNGIGGGILVYSKQGLNILSVENICNFNQYSHFKVSTSLCDQNVFLIYRPPSSNNINNEMLSNVIKNAPKDSLFIGDFNFPKINWNDLTCDSFSNDFMNACIDNNFNQHIDFPTHNKNNILDLVLCNNECVLNVENLGPLSNSDHVMILINTCFDFVNSESNEIKLNWSKANIDDLKNEIVSVDWPLFLSNNDIEVDWNNFKQKLNSVIYKHVPTYKKTNNVSKPVWMNNYIVRLRRKKSTLYKKMKRTNREEDTIQYKEVEKELKKAIRRAKKKFEVKISKQNGNEGKNNFNKYVKSRLGKQTGVGPLIDDNKNVTSKGEEMAEILNNYFSSVFTEDTTGADINIEDLNFDNPVDGITVTKQDIEEKIDKLKPGKAPGPDGISTTLLIKLKYVISIPLQILFQKSIDKGSVPLDWKKAKVIPIFKKGSKGKACNYRPVSLTSVVCKLMESIIRDSITDHLVRNRLINNSQHGFTKDRSCQTNLIEFMDFVTNSIDIGVPVDVIYLDFQKAFDKISHPKLIKKLIAHGIRGNVLKWIKDWLKERRQWVNVNGSESEEVGVGSGVPQGSVLGPILFIIFINDIDRDVQILVDLVRKFADDTKAGKSIRHQKDAEELQEGLNKLCEWGNTWSMSFNVKKCKVMHFGRNNPGNKYMMNGVELEVVDDERDIGVKVSANLKPSKHCQEAASKARVVLGQLSRCFHYRDKFVFLRLYKQYVRPHMEFASAAWSPWLAKDISILEDVQIKAIKMISGLNSNDYEGKLKELNLWSLEKRRIMFDLIQIFKIVKDIGEIKCSIKHVENNVQRGIMTRSQHDETNIIKERANLDCRRNFLMNRSADIWNKLPSETKHSTTVTKFKRSLVKWMKENKLTTRD